MPTDSTFQSTPAGASTPSTDIDAWCIEDTARLYIFRDLQAAAEASDPVVSDRAPDPDGLAPAC